MARKVTLPSGVQADYDLLPDSREGLGGKWDPVSGAPVNEQALSHFHGAEFELHKAGVEMVQKQLPKEK